MITFRDYYKSKVQNEGKLGAFIGNALGHLGSMLPGLFGGWEMEKMAPAGVMPGAGGTAGLGSWLLGYLTGLPRGLGNFFSELEDKIWAWFSRKKQKPDAKTIQAVNQLEMQLKSKPAQDYLVKIRKLIELLNQFNGEFLKHPLTQREINQYLIDKDFDINRLSEIFTVNNEAIEFLKILSGSTEEAIPVFDLILKNLNVIRKATIGRVNYLKQQSPGGLTFSQMKEKKRLEDLEPEDITQQELEADFPISVYRNARNKIEELLDLDYSPKAIADLLSKRGIRASQASKLVNMMVKLRNSRLLGKKRIDYGNANKSERRKLEKNRDKQHEIEAAEVFGDDVRKLIDRYIIRNPENKEAAIDKALEILLKKGMPWKPVDLINVLLSKKYPIEKIYNFLIKTNKAKNILSAKRMVNKIVNSVK